MDEVVEEVKERKKAADERSQERSQELAEAVEERRKPIRSSEKNSYHIGDIQPVMNFVNGAKNTPL